MAVRDGPSDAGGTSHWQGGSMLHVGAAIRAGSKLARDMFAIRMLTHPIGVGWGATSFRPNPFEGIGGR